MTLNLLDLNDTERAVYAAAFGAEFVRAYAHHAVEQADRQVPVPSCFSSRTNMLLALAQTDAGTTAEVAVHAFRNVRDLLTWEEGSTRRVELERRRRGLEG